MGPKRLSRTTPGSVKRRQAKRASDSANREFATIEALVRQLTELKERARTLGIFTEDRDLLKCTNCGLMEDVLIGGELVTYHDASDGKDTGLRFAESTTVEGHFICPECGIEVAAGLERSDG